MGEGKFRGIAKNTAVCALSRIESAVEGVPGWSTIDQLFALYTLAFSSAHLGGDILELGSWCGRSAAAFGLAVKSVGRGKVHCVDLFPERGDWYRNRDGTYSMRVKIGTQIVSAYDEQTVWPEPFKKDIEPFYKKYGSVFKVFKATMKRNGLTRQVIPFRGDIEMFLAGAGRKAKYRLAFIDAHHSYEAVCRDIEMIEPSLIRGAWICFDDAFSSYRGVDRAIRRKILRSGRYDQCQQLTRKLFIARRKF